VRLPEVAGGLTAVAAFDHLPPAVLLTLGVLHLAAVTVLAWAAVRRHRQGVQGALWLVRVMGGAARVTVGGHGEIQVDPVPATSPSEQGNPDSGTLPPNSLASRCYQRPLPGLVATVPGGYAAPSRHRPSERRRHCAERLG
jgi:hypothetical protein